MRSQYLQFSRLLHFTQRYTVLVIFVAAMLFHGTAMASITYIGSSFISAFSSCGNGVYTPGAQPVLNVTLFDDPNAGLKVSQYSVTYAANPLDNGTDVGIFWIAQRGLTSIGVTPVSHINHLDGSVSYTRDSSW